MGYWGEFRVNWRSLVAVGLGLGFGYQINSYITSLFAPQLLQEFGWSKAQFALTGMTVLVGIIILPLAGRLTDRWGVKKLATVGVVAGPLLYLMLATLNGHFYWFMVLTFLQSLLVGSTTTTLVYSRLVAMNFDKARGTALALAACVPPAVAAIGIPLLSRYIEAEGWRSGYVLMACITAAFGALALYFVDSKKGAGAGGHQAGSMKDGFALILKNPAFRIIIGGMFLCNLTLMVQASQLKLILMDRNATSDSASSLLSIYALGIIAGRLLCGLALDRYAAPIVSMIVLGMPGAGMLLLAFAHDAPMLMLIGVLLLGVSMGAELDVAGYLIMKYFDVSVYSTGYSMVAVGTAASAALGALLLSLTLKITDGFTTFLILSGIVTLLGSTLFLFLGRHNRMAAQADAV